MTPADSNAAVDAEQIVEALAALPNTDFARELVRSMGDVVGMDKEDTIGEPFLTRDEDGEFITLYNAYTGLGSRVTVTMLKTLMVRRFGPQHAEVPKSWYGKRVWTATQPKVTARLALPCIFNPESEQYSDVVAAGLGHISCRKANLSNPNEVRLHAEHKHSSYKAFVAHMELSRRNEDRAEQKAMLEAIMALATKSK